MEEIKVSAARLKETLRQLIREGNHPGRRARSTEPPAHQLQTFTLGDRARIGGIEQRAQCVGQRAGLRILLQHLRHDFPFRDQVHQARPAAQVPRAAFAPLARATRAPAQPDGQPV